MFHLKVYVSLVILASAMVSIEVRGTPLSGSKLSALKSLYAPKKSVSQLLTGSAEGADIVVVAPQAQEDIPAPAGRRVHHQQQQRHFGGHRQRVYASSSSSSSSSSSESAEYQPRGHGKTILILQGERQGGRGLLGGLIGSSSSEEQKGRYIKG